MVRSGFVCGRTMTDSSSRLLVRRLHDQFGLLYLNFNVNNSKNKSNNLLEPSPQNFPTYLFFKKGIRGKVCIFQQEIAISNIIICIKKSINYAANKDL